MNSQKSNSKIKHLHSLLDMIYVQGGIFYMGAESDEVDYKNELPAHKVVIDNYYISKYPITQKLYFAVLDVNPSYHLGENLPVEQVSWYDAMDFCRKLNLITGQNYCLPTEAQWEFAARGGCKGKGIYIVVVII